MATLAEAARVPVILGGVNNYEIERQVCRHLAVFPTQAQIGLGSEE